jgi:hypothetical protein
MLGRTVVMRLYYMRKRAVQCTGGALEPNYLEYLKLAPKSLHEVLYPGNAYPPSRQHVADLGPAALRVCLELKRCEKGGPWTSNLEAEARA